MRLGIYGGSFDPIHLGHLLLAECCREQCELDRLLFVPAAQSPHKIDTEPVPATARVEMVQLAIAGHPSFELCTSEVDRGGLSYTIDTLRSLQAEHEGAELFLLMGADTLFDFPQWKSPQDICEVSRLVVVDRPGSAPPDFSVLESVATPSQIMAFEELVVRMPQVDISSSEIRGRISSGRSIRFQTPRPVEEYIRSNGLYRE